MQGAGITMIGDTANRLAGLECRSAAARHGTVTRKYAALFAVIVTSFALALSTSARAATTTVDSLADTGAPGICVLRDAITAANTKAATNDCPAGIGNDTIQFGVTGTIELASTLPTVTDSSLTINGPASPGIIISGSGKVQVMQVSLGAALNLDELTIVNGEAGIGVSGGGIGNEGTLSVSNSTFSNNLSINGGAIYNAFKLVVTNTTFDHNTAFNGFGGAINNSFMASVTNSTFYANVSFRGGGIYNNPPRIGGNPVVTVTNSTFEGNVAAGGSAGGGGGIFNGAVFPGEASVKGTIIAGSTDDDCFGEKIVDLGYNIADDPTCEFQKTGSAGNGSFVNPMLSQAGLANNGGPTQTIALLPGSPAIDAIPLADCTDQALPPNPITTDQRGFPRPDGTESLCDIGAYEFQDVGSAFVPFASFRG